MALTGYKHKFIRRNGGLKSIALIDIDSVANAILSPQQNAYTQILLTAEDKFAQYVFHEDEAEYRENISRVNGALVVTHEISFALDKMGGDTSEIVSALARTAQTGVAAIITTANDDSFLVGYSPEFGKERPLKLSSIKGATGRKLSDISCETIVLRSDDVSKAKQFTGPTSALIV